MKKERTENKKFTGERAEYFSQNKIYTDSLFADGESQLKHSTNIEVDNSIFGYMYPLWNSKDIEVKNTKFEAVGRAGVWYSENLKFENVCIDAPKEFRRCKNVCLKNVDFKNGAETLWSCNDISLENVTVKGDYFAMNSSNIRVDNLTLDGKYPFDGAKNVEIHNSRFTTKDAFWNCENITVYDSYIRGEYLGWESKNLKFVNCTLESEQGFCYIDNLTLENCTLNNSNLLFEYVTNINADIKGKVDSIKNPGSGIIKAEEIDTLILNKKRCNPSATKIICEKINKTYTEDPNINER